MPAPWTGFPVKGPGKGKAGKAGRVLATGGACCPARHEAPDRRQRAGVSLHKPRRMFDGSPRRETAKSAEIDKRPDQLTGWTNC